MPLVFLGSEGITKGALVSDLAHVPLVWRLLTPPQLKQRRPLSEQVYSIAICYLKKNISMKSHMICVRGQLLMQRHVI